MDEITKEVVYGLTATVAIGLILGLLLPMPVFICVLAVLAVLGFIVA